MNISKQTSRMAVAVTAACLVVGGLAGPAARPGMAQTTASSSQTESPNEEVARLSREGWSAYLPKVEAQWKSNFRKLRSPERLRQFVGHLLSIEEKVRQVGSIAGLAKDRRERTRELFREWVFDDREVCQILHAEVQNVRKGLTQWDVELLCGVGVDEDRAVAISQQPAILTDWSASFDRVIDTAVRAAEYDIARYVATMVASSVIGDGVGDVYGAEAGSWEDFFVRLTGEIVADVVIEEVTDPTETIVSALDREIRQAEKTVLYGKNGLMSVLTRMVGEQNRRRESWLLPESSPQQASQQPTNSSEEE